MPEYPADLREAGLSLFRTWFGARYARSTRVEEAAELDDILHGALTVGRQWTVGFAVADTLAAEATPEWQHARATVERRLDAQGLTMGLWAPRGAALPVDEPALSELAVAIEEAQTMEDGRREVRLPANLYLRRTGTTGSVVTVMGGVSGLWAQFTNRVPGTFQLDSREVRRLPMAEAERQELIDRVVKTAGQPDVDEIQTIPASEAWTAVPMEHERSAVFGGPARESDEHSAGLRRNLRRLLKQAAEARRPGHDAHALVLVGAATYAEEEKLSWAVKGMDPALYAGYDIITVIADGLVRRVLEPRRASLPWDAPLA